MPEIGEVARIVNYLQKHIAGKTLAAVKASHDENVFGKVGTSAAEFEKALKGKKVLNARQQGKYFWLEMSSPPHPVMHFGMAGWLKLRNEDTAYYKPTKADSDSEWPPKYWKFVLETAEEPKCEAAFVDFRRFARIRLVDCKAEDLRNTSPLKENGPDPVIDKDVISVDWLKEKLGSKKIPVKALLLDQANISGIGNWVGDEILYNAHIHPEQYSNSLSDSQIAQLHKSLHYVCGLAVETLADSSQFPEEWLFKHRWQKGKKGATMTLADGTKFVYLTVGGRTSAVVPSVQKKTGPVAKDVDEDGEEVETKKVSKKRKAVAKDEPEDEEVAEEKKPAAKKGRGKQATAKVIEESDEKPVHEVDEAEDGEEIKPATKKKQAKSTPKANGNDAKASKTKRTKSAAVKEEPAGRRRSGRTGGKEISYAED